ncbi:MAG: hypothetical protein ACKO55_05955, partial [Bacteroidota bacterium]
PSLVSRVCKSPTISGMEYGFTEIPLGLGSSFGVHCAQANTGDDFLGMPWKIITGIRLRAMNTEGGPKA